MPEYQPDLYPMTDAEARACAERASRVVQDLETRLAQAENDARAANAEVAAVRARLRDARAILGVEPHRAIPRPPRAPRAGGVVRARAASNAVPLPTEPDPEVMVRQ